MAKKKSVKETLDAWRDAEKVYRKSADPYLEGDRDGIKVTKDAIVELAKARSRADQRRDQYFRARLG